MHALSCAQWWWSCKSQQNLPKQAWVGHIYKAESTSPSLKTKGISRNTVHLVKPLIDMDFLVKQHGYGQTYSSVLGPSDYMQVNSLSSSRLPPVQEDWAPTDSLYLAL